MGGSFLVPLGGMGERWYVFAAACYVSRIIVALIPCATTGQSSESVQRLLGTTSQPRFLIPRVDRDRLVELATYGMIAFEPPGFQPCPSPPVFRRSYLEVSTTVDKLFYKQWPLGSMLIIPTVMAVQVPGIHFGHPSWAVKAGAPQGRNVHDISYCDTS